jgi:Spy/CpxP family protein refolding chaperone
MNKKPLVLVFVFVCVCVTFARAGHGLAQPGPASRPARPDRAGPGAAMLDRLRAAMDDLKLSDEQSRQMDQIFQAMSDRVRQMGPELRQLPIEERQQRFRELLIDLRGQILDVLTDEQKPMFEDKIDELRRGGGLRPRRAAPASAEAPKQEAPAHDSVESTEASASRAMAPPGSAKLRPGLDAPPFALERLDGRNVQLSTFNGKVLVILFGNYTSPSFRQRAEEFEQLKREYGRRAEFLIVYTRESHAAGEWEVERNKADGVAIEQPAEMSGRIALAKKARDALKITVPIAVDTMDDKTARDYDATQGNVCVIVGRDGVIVARQNWFSATGVRKQLDELSGGKP